MRMGTFEISEISDPHLYQNVTEAKLTFVDGREIPEEKRKIVPMHIEPGLHEDIMDFNIVGDLKTPLLCCIHLQSKKRRYNFYRTLHELSVLYKFTV